MISAAYVLWVWLHRLARDTRGIVLVLVALLLPVLVGLTGLGVETGLWYAVKRQNQAAADEAALSGAMEVAAAKSDVTAQANCTAWRNGFDGTVVSSTCPSSLTGATVNNPPTSGTYSGNSNYVEVILSQQQNTFFANFNPINLANVTIKTRAVAGPNGSNPVCLLTLSTSGTDVTISGNTQPDLTGCSIDTNSTSSSSVQFNGSPSHLTAYTIVTSGNVNPTYPNSHLTLTKPPTTGAAATPDPYASASHTMPAPCSPGNVTSNPQPNGCYTEISITGNYTFTANSVYYVKGNGTTTNCSTTPALGQFSITGNGTITGSGVTIVLFNGAVLCMAGNAQVTLSAPTSGTWQGTLFWQDKTSTPLCSTGSTCSNIAGTVNAVLTGALYFPHDNIAFNGTSSSTCTVLIANTVSFAGTPNMSAGGCAAAGVTPPTNAGGPIVLVE